MQCCRMYFSASLAIGAQVPWWFAPGARSWKPPNYLVARQQKSIYTLDYLVFPIFFWGGNCFGSISLLSSSKKQIQHFYQKNKSFLFLFVEQLIATLLFLWNKPFVRKLFCKTDILHAKIKNRWQRFLTNDLALLRAKGHSVWIIPAGEEHCCLAEYALPEEYLFAPLTAHALRMYPSFFARCPYFNKGFLVFVSLIVPKNKLQHFLLSNLYLVSRVPFSTLSFCLLVLIYVCISPFG